MKSKSIFAVAAALGLTLILIVAALRQSTEVRAQDEIGPPTDYRVSFGTIGITSGQTLRVSLANTIMPGDPNLPPGPTRVVMTFRYPNGSLVREYKTGDVIRKIVDLERGEAAFLDVDYNRLPPGPIRLQIRPVIRVTPPPITEAGQSATPPDGTLPSVEVINNANGRSQFAVFTNPAVLRGFNPQPDPPE
jgi:hypothetical protein